MTKARREIPPEFKRGTVALLESNGRPLMQIATELGILPSMLRNWRTAFHGGAPRSRAALRPITAAYREHRDLKTGSTFRLPVRSKTTGRTKAA